MTSQDPDFYTRKQIEPNVRIPGIKVGSKGMLGMRLETSEVFVEWFGLNSLCTKNKNKTKQVKKVFREEVIKLRAYEVSRTQEFMYYSMNNIYELSQEREEWWENLQTWNIPRRMTNAHKWAESVRNGKKIFLRGKFLH